MLNTESLRGDFPILEEQVRNQTLIYLDNAATMQMPKSVMERMRHFYCHENANIHRGIHFLSESATQSYEHARITACQFTGAKAPKEIIFTSGTTASINLAARMLEHKIESGDNILVTEMEHHANFIIWQELAKHHHIRLNIVPVRQDGSLDMEQFRELVNERTRIAAFSELSNVTGIENPVDEMTRYLREHSTAYIVLDGAQGIVHCRKKLSDVRPDFYCFSGHKFGAPAGTGILYIRSEIQKEVRPVCFGGGTVQEVTREGNVFLEGPVIYEPGTPNYAGVIGMEAAMKYWMQYDTHILEDHEDALIERLRCGLEQLDGVIVLGGSLPQKGCVSIDFEDIHSYDFCRFLDQYGIAARSGHHCAMPYLYAMGHENAVRFSVAPYNTFAEIDTVLERCGEIVDLFRKAVHHANRRNRK